VNFAELVNYFGLKYHLAIQGNSSLYVRDFGKFEN
jgi:hypothetical protein